MHLFQEFNSIDSYINSSLVNKDFLKKNSLGNIKSTIGHLTKKSSKKSVEFYQKKESFFDFIQEKSKKYYKYISKKDTVKKVLIFKSLSYCMKVPFNGSDVIYSRHKEKKSSLIKGLFRCKSYFCPECAKIILSERCKEIKKAINKHLLNYNSGIYLLTLTLRHKKKDDVQYLINKLREAKKLFWQSYSVKKFRKTSDILGHITGFECNYNDSSGYHPHYHILVFTNKRLNISFEEKLLQREWLRCLKKVGIIGKKDISLTFKGGDQANNYLTKLANEISSDNKEGKNSYSIWGLAKNGYKDTDNGFIDKYFNICKAIKTTNIKMLYWSKGLKAHFSINEITEREIIEKKANKYEDILKLIGTDHIKLKELGYLSIVKYYLSSNRIVDLFTLLDNLGIFYEDLRNNKGSIQVNNVLLKHNYYDF